MADFRDLLNAGLTYRQLDHWTRKGYLRNDADTPCGSGHVRTWPAGEVAVARTMARLTTAGLTVPAAHAVARGQAELAPGVRVLVEEVAASA